MFLVMVNYIKPLEEIEQYLKEHIQFLDHYYAQEKFIFSGRRNPRTGGLILMNLNSKEEIQQIIKEDPFHIYGMAEYEIIEFTPTKYDANFAPFVR